MLRALKVCNENLPPYTHNGGLSSFFADASIFAFFKDMIVSCKELAVNRFPILCLLAAQWLVKQGTMALGKPINTLTLVKERNVRVDLNQKAVPWPCWYIWW